MRAILCGLVFFVAVVGASVEAELKAQTRPEVEASEVTLEDLQGVVLNIGYTFVSRSRSSKGEFTGGRQVQLEVKLGPSASIQVTSRETGWIDHPAGRKTKTISRSFAGKIGVPGKNKDGSASILWIFDKGTLTRLNVAEVGGLTTKISFKRNAASFLCSAEVALAQEVGAGNRVDRSPGGGKLEVLHARLADKPTCRVVEKS